MAQGGGRGWFHRKRQQPEPEADNGTTHASTLRPATPDSSHAPVGASGEASNLGSSWIPGTLPTQASVAVANDNAQWSPEARSATPVRPEASPVPTTSQSPGVAPAATAGSNPRPDQRPAAQEWAPSQTAAPTPAGSAAVTSDAAAQETSRTASVTGSGSLPKPDGHSSPTSATSPTTSASSSSSAPAAEPAPTPPSPSPTTSIDWDVATAAALTDDEGATETTLPHSLPKTSPDRLLEDLIREIVGDAAADTVSSLQTPRAGASESLTVSSGELPSQETREPAIRAEEPVETASPSVSPQLDQDSTAIPGASSEPAASGEHNLEPGYSVPEFATEMTSTTQGDAHQWSPAVTDSAARTSFTPDTRLTPPADETPAEALTSEAAPASPPASSSTVVPGTLDPRESPDEPPLDRIQTDPPSLPTIDIPASVSRETTAQELATAVSRETSTQYGGTPLADQLADETRRRQALEGEILPLPARTRIMTISNQKGGVGKTTTAVNLAAALARTGAHVLVIDLDPQGNASTALGVDHRSEQQSVYEVLVADLPLSEVVQPSTEHERLDCVPATIHLAGAEIELVSLVAREQRLRRALDAHLAAMDRPYDYVFIDCPPSLGLLTINAFVAAREVLIPIQCEYYALEGLSQLLSNIELIEKHLNPDLRLSPILLTMYDSRTNLAQQVAQEVRDHFPTQTLGTIIPRSVRVSEAPSYGQSVISYDFASTGSLSYREAAAEIARRGLATQNTQ